MVVMLLKAEEKKDLINDEAAVFLDIIDWILFSVS